MGAAHKLEPGDAFPDLDLESGQGQLRLSRCWQNGPLVVAFMRHFGCAFCREQLVELTRSWPEIQAANGDVVAVFQYGAEATEQFCRSRGVPFTCAGDPKLEGWDRLALGRGERREYLSLKVVRGWARAAKNSGVRVGSARGGDMTLRPGTFVLAKGGAVVLAHYNQDATDNPRIEDLLSAVRSAS